jgi:S-adenosylmethionine synthetase
MKIISDNVDGINVSVELGSRVGLPQTQIIERKGWGHPDKLADDLAETLSRQYAKRSLEMFGAILHHNFDKLCLLGGSSAVKYGSGYLTKPIRVLVNGRASSGIGSQSLEVEELIVSACKDFFQQRLPSIAAEKDLQIELNLSTASSPGRVLTTNDNDRNFWFSPRSIEDLPERKRLHANDTSIGTGYAPLTALEQMVLTLVDKLSSNMHVRPPWMGTDVKMMACQIGDRTSVVVCVPQLANHVPSKEIYASNLGNLHAELIDNIASYFPQSEIELSINARDKFESDELYLTALGSSIESGDEGVVGRGNRVNGLITPMRAMNVEGANGKNPVYHVGKLYNIVSQRLAKDLSDAFKGNFVVNLVSRTGSDLVRPWQVIVQTDLTDIDQAQLAAIVANHCISIPQITEEIVTKGIMLS